MKELLAGVVVAAGLVIAPFLAVGGWATYELIRYHSEAVVRDAAGGEIGND